MQNPGDKLWRTSTIRDKIVENLGEAAEDKIQVALAANRIVLVHFIDKENKLRQVNTHLKTNQFNDTLVGLLSEQLKINLI